MDFDNCWCKMKLRVCLFCFCCFQHTFVESSTTKTFSEVKSGGFSLSRFQRCRQMKYSTSKKRKHDISEWEYFFRYPHRKTSSWEKSGSIWVTETTGTLHPSKSLFSWFSGSVFRPNIAGLDLRAVFMLHLTVMRRYIQQFLDFNPVRQDSVVVFV